MRVLHLIKAQGIGGAERHLLTLLPALRTRGVDARMLSLDGGLDAAQFHDALTVAGVPWLRVECGADVSPRLARAVIRSVREVQPDLLHTHMVHADVYGSLAAHVLRLPFVSTRHNDDRYLLGPFRFVDRGFMLGVRRIVAISDAVREFHIRAGLPQEKLETIHYGLDAVPGAPSRPTPAAAGIAVGAPLVVAVGRLIAQKDHATLLQAFAQVRRDHRDARLAILGWGPLEAELRAQAAVLGLDASVLMLGRVEPRDWLERADVFAHTSRWEGFGLVLLEAMLAGLPVVATRVSAVPEIVEDGVTGLLVPPGDAGAVAAAVEHLLTNTRRARTLGEAGLARARSSFSVAEMTERTHAVYRGALA